MNIMELIKKEVQAAIQQLATPQAGIVSSVSDGKDYTVKVVLDSTGAETGWLRIMVPVSGVKAGMGIRLPKEGDEVYCVFSDFDYDSGYVIGACLNDTEELPTGGNDSLNPNDMIIAQWENGGMVAVENSRDGSAPVVKITNNQGDMVKVDGGTIQIFVAGGKLVEIGDDGAKFLAYADQTDARLAQLESVMASHAHLNGNFGAPTGAGPIIPFIAGGTPPGGSVTTSKIKGK